MKIFIAVFVATIILAACTSETGHPAIPSPPSSLKKPVTDEYHGIKVTDDYRWLEDFASPEVKEWIARQNRYSRTYFDKLTSRGAILTRLKQLYTKSPSYSGLTQRQDVLFAMKDQPPKNHPSLVAFNAAGDPSSERVIVDPDKINPNTPTAIDWYVASLDGKRVAVSLSENGSEDGSVRVFDTTSGMEAPDVVPRVQFATAGGDLAWNSDATGFWYTRYPQGDERPAEDRNFYQQVYFHRLGTPAKEDAYVIGEDFPRIAEITLQTTKDGRTLLVAVANGDGGEFAHYLMSPEGKWTQVTRFSDKVVSAALAKNDTLYMLSRQEAPRGKILAVSASAPNLASARTVVAAGENVIQYFRPSADRLFVVDSAGGPQQVRVFDASGAPRGSIPIPPVSAVREITPLEDGSILYGRESCLEPPSVYRFDPGTGQSTKTMLSVISPVDFSDVEVVRELATSTDGTKVPMSIIRRKGAKLDGQNPVLLYGYGGYNVSLTPEFSDRVMLWIEQGGIYVNANIRGGGEFGEEWHLAGNLSRKQNVFDDFAACAKYLIEHKYTSAARLAIMGESNGGLLMGASLTQHPDMFRAVVSRVGIYDMLRVELSPNGTFNITEYGTVTNPEQFKAMYAYSPYHNVKDGASYPAVLMTTGDNDSRVDPMQSRKMTARLQAATGSKLPVLLVTSASAGHGFGTALDDRLAEDADIVAFIMDQLGMGYQTLR